MDAERIQRLNGHLERGTLIRKEWGDGYTRACLLAALAPECAAQQSSMACPADVMPRWLAVLVPAIDDEGSSEAWGSMVRRFASCAAKWHTLSADAWRRVEARACLEVLAIAEEVAKLPCIHEVQRLWQQVLAGDPPLSSTWEIAQDAVEQEMQDAVEQETISFGTLEGANWLRQQVAEGVYELCANDYGLRYAVRLIGPVYLAGSPTASCEAMWDRVTSVLLSAIETEVCDDTRTNRNCEKVDGKGVLAVDARYAGHE